MEKCFIMIELCKITHDNFEAVLELKVADGKKDNVDSNIYRLADAYVDLANNKKPPMLFAIYNGDEVIGLAEMGFYELEENAFFHKKFGDRTNYEIIHFMIDEKHQGKGLGKQAMAKIIVFLRSFPQGEADTISLSYWMRNDAARRLYASVGFVETGDIWDGETFEKWDAKRKDVEYAEIGVRLGL